MLLYLYLGNSINGNLAPKRGNLRHPIDPFDHQISMSLDLLVFSGHSGNSSGSQQMMKIPQKSSNNLRTILHKIFELGTFLIYQCPCSLAMYHTYKTEQCFPIGSDGLLLNLVRPSLSPNMAMVQQDLALSSHQRKVSQPLPQVLVQWPSGTFFLFSCLLTLILP